MKVILNCGKTIRVTETEGELIQNFLMGEDWEDRHMKVEGTTWYFTKKVMVIKANDISAVL